MKYMKRFNLFYALCAVVLSLSFAACGSDDDHGGNGGSYNPGRKLAKLTIKDLKVSSQYIEKGSDDVPDIYKYEVEYGDFVFEMGYDTQGRLNRIVLKNAKKLAYDADKRKYYYEDIPVNAEIALIDYELSTVSVKEWLSFDGKIDENDKILRRFALNDKGYITQIRDYSITYDADGYLKEVKATNKMWTVAYRDQEFVGWLEENLKSMNMLTYYIDINKEKETTFVKFKEPFNSYPYDKGNLIHDMGIKVFALVAYQCGLLGRITKTYKSITDIKDNPINIATNNEYHSYSYDREIKEEDAFKINLEYQ